MTQGATQGQVRDSFAEGYRRRLVIASLLVLLAGFLYYALWRIQWFGVMLPSAWDVTGGRWPSFSLMVSVSLIALALWPRQVRYGIVTVCSVLACLSVLEWNTGTADWGDQVALLLGAMPCIGWFGSAWCKSVSSGQERAVSVGLLLSACALSLGSTVLGDSCVEYDTDGFCVRQADIRTPVYMDYQTLRDRQYVQPVRTPSSLKSMLLHGQYVLAVERNAGVHIYDNSNPAAPVAKAFLAIPGVTQTALRDHYLYVDSYVDFLVFDLSDANAISMIKRIEDVFPFDPYQNIPSHVRFYNERVDSSKGVIVGYF